MTRHPESRWQSLLAYRQEHPLGYRMVLHLLAWSLAFVVVSTLIQVAIEYRREMRVIEQRIELIRNVYLSSLAKSIWDVDQDQLRLQMRGILDFPDIQALVLEDADSGQRLVLGATEGPTPRGVSHRFELAHQTVTGPRALGQLEVRTDLGAVYARLGWSALSLFLGQTLTIFLLMLVALLIFQRLVTRHLESMARYASTLSAGSRDAPLRLQRRPSEHRDELDALVNALNELRLAIIQDISRRELAHERLLFSREQLRRRVDKRTRSLRQAKDAAEAASRARSLFLAGISHEIRTPMSGILGMTELLTHTPLSEQGRSYLAALRQSGDQLLSILDGVLDYAKLEEGSFVPEQQVFNLRQLVEEQTLLTRAQLQGKPIQVSYRVEEQLPQLVLGAAGCVRQVLANLLGNAVKFTAEGIIELSVSAAEKAPDRLRFSVRDSGIGISTAQQQRIFERFTQADESITRRFGGTGLGLAICQKLVAALGGHIGVQSTEGQGSLFWFEVPLEAAELPSEHEADQAHIALPSLSLLLVEDTLISQQVIAGLLEHQGHLVQVAADGTQALGIARQQAFDAILMDMHLPGMSGIEVTRYLRAEPEGLNAVTPVIALTASIGVQDIEGYRAAGVDAVLSKPLQLDALQRVLANLCPPTGAGADEPTPAADGVDRQLLALHRQVFGQPRLCGLFEQFEEQSEAWLAQLDEALQLDDPYELGEVAHKLVGSCQTLGLVEAARHAQALESCGRDGDLTAAANRLGDLRKALARTLPLARHISTQP